MCREKCILKVITELTHSNWKHGSVVKYACFSCKESEFSSQSLHSSSHHSITLVSGKLKALSSIHKCQAYMWYTGKILMHVNLK